MSDGNRRSFWLFSFVLIPFALGCGGATRDTVKLTLISPHRDEIREEVALAFQDWFEQRTHDRLATAEKALASWLDNPLAETANMPREAFRTFFADWAADDLAKLRKEFQTWDDSPNPHQGRSLQQLAAQELENLPRAEIVWQDVGGGTTQIAKFVTARFRQSSEGIGIDLVFGGGTDIFLRFAREGLLAPVTMPPEVLASIPAQLHGMPIYDPQGRWWGPMLTSFGILYNREVLQRIGEEPPQRWQDLGKPGLRGWVSAGDPRLTGSVHMVYEIILQGNGWEDGFRLLLRMGANAHGFIRDSGTLTRTVISGEVAVAGNLDANAMSAVGRDPARMGFILPQAETVVRPDGQAARQGGTVTNPDAMAVLKGAPRLELARLFVEFTLREEGQCVFLLRPGVHGGPRRYPLCRLSVRPDLYEQYPPEQRSVGTANPFANRTALDYNTKVSGQRWDALNDLFGATIMDAHADLSAAWKAVCESRLPAVERQRLEEQLFRPPCTEADMLEHARRIVEQGPRSRLETVNRWGEEARERYRAIRRAAQDGTP